MADSRGAPPVPYEVPKFKPAPPPGKVIIKIKVCVCVCVCA